MVWSVALQAAFGTIDLDAATELAGGLLNALRPTPEGPIDQRTANAALAMVTMDPSVNVLSSVILPVTQPYLGRG